MFTIKWTNWGLKWNKKAKKNVFGSKVHVFGELGEGPPPPILIFLGGNEFADFGGTPYCAYKICKTVFDILPYDCRRVVFCLPVWKPLWVASKKPRHVGINVSCL